MVLISIFTLVVVLIQGPVPQDAAYHRFIDSRSFWSVPNFLNVVSNITFFIVGVTGLYKIIIQNRLVIQVDLRPAYLLIFAGAILVAFGSGYYHLSPDNMTLLWDRLPMTITFMALFSIVIGEFISLSLAKRVLWPLLIAGCFSVLYWLFTELNGVGDLRAYILVQFLPILMMPVIFVCFKSRFTHHSGYWALFAAYAFAKLFEYYDAEIFNLSGIISGHTLKHISAAIGLYFLLKTYERRQSQA